MQKYFQKLYGFFAKPEAETEDDSGATAIEYGLIAALIAVAIIGAVTAVGDSTSKAFQNVSDNMAAASP